MRIINFSKDQNRAIYRKESLWHKIFKDLSPLDLLGFVCGLAGIYIITILCFACNNY